MRTSLHLYYFLSHFLKEKHTFQPVCKNFKILNEGANKNSGFLEILMMKQENLTHRPFCISLSYIFYFTLTNSLI